MKYKKTFDIDLKIRYYISKGFRFTIVDMVASIRKENAFCKRNGGWRVVFKRKFRKRKNFRYLYVIIQI